LVKSVFNLIKTFTIKFDYNLKLYVATACTVVRSAVTGLDSSWVF